MGTAIATADSGASVQALLQDIYDRNGELTAELVVKEASAKGSPLNGYFEWDNKAAGFQYRLEQARALIRRVTIVVHKPEPIVMDLTKVKREVKEAQPPTRQERVRGWAFIKSTESYKPIGEVLGDDELRAELLEDAKRDWLAFKRKHGQLDELGDLIAKGDEVFFEVE